MKQEITFKFIVTDNPDNKFAGHLTIEALYFIYQGISKLPEIGDSKFTVEEKP